MRLCKLTNTSDRHLQPLAGRSIDNSTHLFCISIPSTASESTGTRCSYAISDRGLRWIVSRVLPDGSTRRERANIFQSAQTEGTTFAYEHYPNSGLVVRHGDDHVSFNREFKLYYKDDQITHVKSQPVPEQESTRITKEFLRTGVLPCAKEDTFVTVYGPRAPREPPVANPYDVPTGFVAGDIDSA